MVEIAPTHWSSLPELPTDADAVALSWTAVERLAAQGYLRAYENQRANEEPSSTAVERLTAPDHLRAHDKQDADREPSPTPSSWSATGAVEGVDGKMRRWIYRYEGTPARPRLSWLEPALAAERILRADLISSVHDLGVGIVRLRAVLGPVVARGQAPRWSRASLELSLRRDEQLAMLARRVGAFTVHGSTVPLSEVGMLQASGTDLVYDELGRQALYHAILTGDARFLRWTLKQSRAYGVDPAGLVHRLQDHPELPLQLAPLSTGGRQHRYRLRGKSVSEKTLRQTIEGELRSTLLAVPFHREMDGRISGTTVSLIAATLGIRRLSELPVLERSRIRQVHLLLALYNAFQPGVFAISGWDLVGAIPLAARGADSKLQRGHVQSAIDGLAYDLVGAGPSARSPGSGRVPCAALYGPLPRQLERADSFASQLERLLAIREQYRIAQAKQLALPEVTHPSLLVLVHALPREGGLQLTALNFSARPLSERVRIPSVTGEKTIQNLLEKTSEADQLVGNHVTLSIAAFQAKVLLLR
jgi:trehalose synthase